MGKPTILIGVHTLCQLGKGETVDCGEAFVGPASDFPPEPGMLAVLGPKDAAAIRQLVEETWEYADYAVVWPLKGGGALTLGALRRLAKQLP